MGKKDWRHDKDREVAGGDEFGQEQQNWVGRSGKGATADNKHQPTHGHQEFDLTALAQGGGVEELLASLQEERGGGRGGRNGGGGGRGQY
jgi:hypothetical protein